jgi:protoporphyrinogen oxidase
MKVIIIGAGLCGLTAAHHLLSAGVDVEIYEKEQYPGGLAADIGHEGFTYDLGVHIFHMMDPYAISLIRTIMGNNLHTREYFAKSYIDGTYFNYPPSVEKIADLPEEMRTKIQGAIPATAPPDDADNEKDFDTWLVRRMGRPFFEHYFEGYTAKYWGLPPRQISADLIKTAYQSLFQHKQVIKTYPVRGGIGQFARKLSDEIRAKGGRIFIQSEITGLSRDDSKIISVHVKTLDDSRDISSFDYIINTSSLVDVCRWMDIPFPENLDYRSMIILLIQFSKPRILDVDFIHFSPDSMIITRIYEPKRFSKDVSPDDTSSLVVEIPCKLGDGIWNMPDDQILSRAADDLENAGLIDKANITGFDVTRLEYSHPVYTLDYKVDLQGLLERINPYKNFITTGRLGIYRYGTMDSSIRMGLEAAEDILTRN